MMFAQDSPLVILDTSVFLSALLSKNPNSAPCQIIRYWREDRFKLVISPQLLEELVEKLLVKNIDRNDIKDILRAIFYTAIKIQGIYQATLLDQVDPNDNMFLAAAYEIGADYLVSLDKKHILPLKHYHHTQILSPNLFLQVLQNS
ncbi:MAG: putative toxin-antitoxin system toxin component, PIN family [Microcystis sp. M114S2]|jgi:putative PIN family toxin of toxin-antitoxin system|uniref:putative toxin-antitoxin system toxin component, PIN family n=1 Tax=unclassified Microcystis TaxID=2643300 RepID=UPI000CC241A4|nr:MULTISPECIES: putative toxin-antitoxin system toxin component, PIN family [unclassified Microcystis]MCA2847654.1 putative toxin-antitoxin system toxin component, PIN family [Microcystis sp. M074S1]NCR52882.1 putative toxin-antitoxin system toxin component, PIN family [Microcystis aeruginosa L211-07]GBE73640.1 PilT protein domain protein [Microcystis aeruginosa NIES-87]MCA2657127.1 putative toxin-antitoxin system toxin component, PIN family [Microcystis sp. M049S2]MCA2669398.1 putative toxin